MRLLPAHRQPSARLAELWDTLTPWPVGWPATMFGTHLIRVEDTIEDDHFVVRAEIPGIDPATDIEVCVHDHRLDIKAERSEKHEERRHSEFSYGSFVRTLTLPPDATDEGIDARYANGILTVSVPLGQTQETEHVKKVDVKPGE